MDEKMMLKNMSLEEYKHLIRERLLEFNSKSRTQRLMKIHKNYFKDYLEDGWTVNEAATGMEMNLI